MAVLHAVGAHAQAIGEAPGRFELGAGPIWAGASSFGTSDATETAADGGGFRLFSTSTKLASATGVEARAGFGVTRLLQAELAVSYAEPELRTIVSADSENAVPLTASETLQRVAVEGAVVLSLARWRFGPWVPFVRGGTGYLRQLHQARALVEGGQIYDAGGGVSVLIKARPRARVKGLGLRADVRGSFRPKAIALDGRHHLAPEIAASVFSRF
jgi:hypothetical protein